MASPADICTYVKRTWEHDKEYFRPWNSLFGRLIAFTADQEHYIRDTGITLDRRRVQPKGQQLFNHVRHKSEQICKVPPFFQCRPRRPQADSSAAEVARRILENIVSDPALRYRVVRRKMVLGGLMAGRGAVAIEWDPRAGLCFRVVDPRRLFPCAGFGDHHDPRNPYITEEIPMRISQLRAMRDLGWKLPANLHADWTNLEEPQSANQRDTSRIDLEAAGSALNQPGTDEGSKDDGLVRVIKHHARWDPFAQTTKKKKSQRELPMDKWHYLDRISGHKMPYDGSPPPMSPINGQPYQLMTSEAQYEDHYQYPQGYLCVTAPGQSGNEPLFEDNWTPGAVNTDVVLSHFPYMIFVCNLHPLRLFGKSDTELLHSLQVIDNASLRSAWEQLRVAQAVLIAQKGTLFDSEDRTFQLTDQVMQMAWTQDRLASEGIKFFQAPGMNPSTPAFRQMLDRAWSYIGNGDIQVPAGNTRNVPVGTIDAMMQQGDLPVLGHQENLFGEEAIGFRVALDLKRAYTKKPELLSWVNDMGEHVYTEADLSGLGEINVEVTTSPQQHQLDADRVQAVAQFGGQIQGVPPPLWGDMARAAGFDQKTVQVFQQMAQQAQAPKDQTPKSRPDQMITALAAIYKVDPTGQVAQAVINELNQAGLTQGQPGAMPAAPPQMNGNPQMAGGMQQQTAA